MVQKIWYTNPLNGAAPGAAPSVELYTAASVDSLIAEAAQYLQTQLGTGFIPPADDVTSLIGRIKELEDWRTDPNGVDAQLADLTERVVNLEDFETDALQRLDVLEAFKGVVDSHGYTSIYSANTALGYPNVIDSIHYDITSAKAEIDELRNIKVATVDGEGPRGNGDVYLGVGNQQPIVTGLQIMSVADGAQRIRKIQFVTGTGGTPYYAPAVPCGMRFNLGGDRYGQLDFSITGVTWQEFQAPGDPADVTVALATSGNWNASVATPLDTVSFAGTYGNNDAYLASVMQDALSVSKIEFLYVNEVNLDLQFHKSDSVAHITAAERIKWNGYQAQIDDEISRATLAEETLQANIDSEEARATAAEAVLQTNIDNEVTRATTAEQLLQTNIDSEEARAIAAETLLQNNIDAEETRAITAETTLQTNITTVDDKVEAHLADSNNPHNVTLQQASDEQSTNPTTIAAGLYETSVAAPNKLLTRAEVQAEIGSPLRYRGQLKYGAMTVADMNGIASGPNPNDLTVGDFCGVQETQLTYTWDGTNWNANAQGTDTTGDMWDILFWYGTWVDGKAYNGEVSAQIKCQDGANHVFDLVVLTDVLLDNEVTDPKIGTRSLSDAAADSTLISTGPFMLTAFMQGVRNNLKSLFAQVSTKVETTTFNAHTSDMTMHVTSALQTAWNNNITNFNTHNTDNVRHITAAERSGWNSTSDAVSLHIANNDIHVTAAKKNAWDQNISDLSAEVARATAAEQALQTLFDNLRKSGHFIGTYATPANLPSVSPTDSNSIAIGDFCIVFVNADNVPAIFKVATKSGNNITWTQVIEMAFSLQSVFIDLPTTGVSSGTMRLEIYGKQVTLRLMRIRPNSVWAVANWRTIATAGTVPSVYMPTNMTNWYGSDCVLQYEAGGTQDFAIFKSSVRLNTDGSIQLGCEIAGTGNAYSFSAQLTWVVV